MTRNISGMPGYRTLTPAEKLAGAFAKEIRENLTTQQLAHVVLRNKAYARIHGEDRACASHDFIDSNVCMLDAFKKTFMFAEPNPDNQAVADVMNEAWSLAKKEGFRA
jgi:hypothetical protein